VKTKKLKKVKKSRKASSGSESGDDFDKIENERLRDLKERDEFAQRLVQKDKDKQRNIVQKSDQRAYEEAAKRIAMVSSFKDTIHFY